MEGCPLKEELQAGVSQAVYSNKRPGDVGRRSVASVGRYIRYGLYLDIFRQLLRAVGHGEASGWLSEPLVGSPR